MRKLALFAALAALAIAVPLSWLLASRGASDLDRSDGDDTDTYAFTAQDAPALTIVGNWVPFEASRRTELLQVRRQRALLPEHRQHR